MLILLILFTLDVVEDGNTSSHNSPAEKTDIKTSTSEDDKSSPSREVNLDSLWPYPQQLTLIKGSCYFPEAYLSVRILKNGEEGNILFHSCQVVRHYATL